MKLAYEVLRSPSATTTALKNPRSPVYLGVMMHGILARRSNVRSFAKMFVDRLPELRVVLVDHRGHGDSAARRMPGPNTLRQCALDVREVVEEVRETIRAEEGISTVEEVMVMGHSFGGKVALAYRELVKPPLVWCLDSPPGFFTREEEDDEGPTPPLSPPRRSNDSVSRLMGELKRMRDRKFKSKQEVVQTLQELRFSPMVSNWMTTNLVLHSSDTTTSSYYTFAFDLDVISDLFTDYRVTDFLPSLARCDTDVRFLRAGRNRSGWPPLTLETLAALETTTHGKVQLATLPTLGHWLHAENPTLVFDTIFPSVLAAVARCREERGAITTR